MWCVHMCMHIILLLFVHFLVMFLKNPYRFLVIGTFLLCFLAFSSVLSVQAQNAEQITREQNYSALEERLAQELIATGELLEGNANFDDVVSALAGRLPNGANITQEWVRKNLQEILPQVKNKMAVAAINTATDEIAKGAGNIANDFAYAQFGLSDVDDYAPDNSLKHSFLRSGLESIRAAAKASDLYALNSLEMEYSLASGGLGGYSLLTVQPFWDSMDKRHNVFMQVSASNKEAEDTVTDTSIWRDTVNLGLSYRYITPDERHMFGSNIFFDHQWPYHHNRMSLGIDYKTGLYGIAFNKYFGLSDWRDRNDGYEEKALGGEDIEISGRLPDAPQLELFAKGYHWEQEKTAALNPDGDDIWGYQFAAEYTPVNAFTFRSEATQDNEDGLEGQITVRLNYKFVQSWDDLWKRSSYNPDSVMERRFEKVSRTNEIRVQVRQNEEVTARVTFAQGANVSVGDDLAFGTTITTGSSAGDSVTVVFGNGARLDVGQSTSITVEKDKIVLTSGIIQFTSGSGGITVITVPGGTINLLGTDVDVRVSGSTSTLRVRDGAANFKNDDGTTYVAEEELAASSSSDGSSPQVYAEGTATYETHVSAAHEELDLVGPIASVIKAAPYASSDVVISGTLGVGNTLTFTVPLSKSVTVSGSPQLAFTLGGLDRLANYDSGSGTTSLTFTYVITNADQTLSNIVAQSIEKNGGTLTGTNGANMVRELSGTFSGSVPDVTAPTISSFSASSSGSSPAEAGDVITITMDANEDLVQSGTPSLTLDIGGSAKTANFSTINSGNAEFIYTVESGDNDSDGIEITAITVDVNELEDAVGNDLNITFALPESLGVNVQTNMIATGGTITRDGDYLVHTFTSSGTFTVTGAGEVDFLIVAGGGGGGSNIRAGGGGGAGGLRKYVTGEDNNSESGPITVTAQEYYIVVGAGGAAKAKGGNSIALGLTAVGGGAGGSSGNGGSGGSGGGAAKTSSSSKYTAGSGISGQGNSGGSGYYQYRNKIYAGGGGGGAGSGAGTKGGSGLQSSITGTATYYAGGGGGGKRGSSSQFSGGSGGGGKGRAGSNSGSSGTDGLGGGGGGGSSSSSSSYSGGSGVVIIRYYSPP